MNKIIFLIIITTISLSLQSCATSKLNSSGIYCTSKYVDNNNKSGISLYKNLHIPNATARTLYIISGSCVSSAESFLVNTLTMKDGTVYSINNPDQFELIAKNFSIGSPRFEKSRTESDYTLTSPLYPSAWKDKSATDAYAVRKQNGHYEVSLVTIIDGNLLNNVPILRSKSEVVSILRFPAPDVNAGSLSVLTKRYQKLEASIIEWHR